MQEAIKNKSKNEISEKPSNEQFRDAYDIAMQCWNVIKSHPCTIQKCALKLLDERYNYQVTKDVIV